MSPTHILILTFFLLISTTFSTITSYSEPKPEHKPDPKYDSFIKTACNTTTYPVLCRKTILPYASKIKADPRKLVITALSVTLTAAQSSASNVADLATRNGLAKYEANAVGDCIENVGASIDDLKKSIAQMDDLGTGNSRDVRFKISNIQTWMSAALTNENTCMDGIGEKRVSLGVKVRIRGCILKLAKLTSNSLSLFNHVPCYKRVIVNEVLV